MAIIVNCDCGNQLKLRDDAAGRRIRCPECSGPVDVPEAEDDWDDGEFDEYDQAYGKSRGGYDDDFDDEHAGDYDRASRGRASSRARAADRHSRQRTPARSSRSRGGRKKKKQQGSGLGLGLAIGLGAIALLTGAVFGVMALVGGGDVSSDAVADNSNNSSSTNNGSGGSSNSSGAANMGGSNPNANQTTQPTNNRPSNVVNNQQDAAKPNGNGRVWCVLSNFRQLGNGFGIDKNYSVDYRVVSGNPNSAGSVVLYLSKNNIGIIQEYAEVNVTLQQSGTIEFSVGGSFGIGGFQANLATKEGHQKWREISGKMRPGGGQTTSVVPKTITEQAGAAAAGKAIVLGNPRRESQFGRTAYLVDFTKKQQLTGNYYFLVVKDATGQGFEVNISSDLRFARVGVEDTIGGRPLGIGRMSGQVSAHIEQRSSPAGIRFRGQEAKVISNTVKF